MSRKDVPNFEPSDKQREEVMVFASVGVPHEYIAMLVKNGETPISVDTLTRHFKEELAEGKAKVIGMVGGKLVRTALGQNAKANAREELIACMFFLKTQAQWRETERHDHFFPEMDGNEADDTAQAARLASIIEGARRRKLKVVGGTDVE